MSKVELNKRGIYNVLASLKFQPTFYNLILPRVKGIKLDESKNKIIFNIGLTEEEKEAIIDVLTSGEFNEKYEHMVSILSFFMNKEFRKDSAVVLNCRGKTNIINEGKLEGISMEPDTITINDSEEKDKSTTMRVMIMFYNYLHGQNVPSFYDFTEVKGLPVVVINDDIKPFIVPIYNNVPVILPNMGKYTFFIGYRVDRLELNNYGVPQKLELPTVQELMKPLLEEIEALMEKGKNLSEVMHYFRYFVLKYWKFNLANFIHTLNLKDYPYLNYIMPSYLHFDVGGDGHLRGSFYIPTKYFLDDIFSIFSIVRKAPFPLSDVPLKKTPFDHELPENEKPTLYCSSKIEKELLMEAGFDDWFELELTSNAEEINEANGFTLEYLRELFRQKKPELLNFALVLVNDQLMKERISSDPFKTVTGKEVTANSIAFMHNPYRYAYVSPVYWYLYTGNIPDTVVDGKFVYLLERRKI